MFRLTKIQNGRQNQAEPCFLPTTASETYHLGEALTLTGGALTKCASTTTPAYIAAEDYTAPATGNRALYVYPVDSNMRFECPVTAAPTSLLVGDQITLAADAMGVTATKTNGVATIRDLAGAASVGDKIIVSF